VLSVTRRTTRSARDCLPRRRCSPAERCLARTQAQHGRQPGLPAQPSCRAPERAAASGARAGARTCTQLCTGQAADQIANTPRNTRVRPPRSCYSYRMISPIRGNRTEIRVQVPPRTRCGLHVLVRTIFTFRSDIPASWQLVVRCGAFGRRDGAWFCGLSCVRACFGLVVAAVLAGDGRGARGCGGGVVRAARRRGRRGSCGAVCGFSGAARRLRGERFLPAGCSRLPGCAGYGR
jgi:hypothetical protein